MATTQEELDLAFQEVGARLKELRTTADRVVIVTSTGMARPTTTGIVTWVGGTTEPTNMAVDDIWMKNV